MKLKAGDFVSENALSIDKKVDLEKLNQNVDKRILKITREKLDYLLQIEEDGVIVHDMRIKDIDSIKQQLEGIAAEVNLYWQDKDGGMNIRLNSKENQTEIIQLVNYASYPKDVIFKTTLEMIQKEEKSSSKVVSEKEATNEFLGKVRKFLIGATVLGVSSVLYAFHIEPDVDKLNDQIRYEADPIEENKEVAAINDGGKAVMDYAANVEVSTGDLDSDTHMIYLYDQPLLPRELNIYMYQMSEKYHIPYQSLISIAHVESDGNFNNHGKTGCSGDQGVMQINPANYPVLFENLGYTPDQIQNDDQVNIECAAFLLQDMYERNKKRNGQVDMDELYREYNGGGDFKNIPATEDYLSKIHDAINLIYNDNNLICVEISELGVSK